MDRDNILHGYECEPQCPYVQRREVGGVVRRCGGKTTIQIGDRRLAHQVSMWREAARRAEQAASSEARRRMSRVVGVGLFLRRLARDIPIPA